MQFFEFYEHTDFVRHVRPPSWQGQHIRPRFGRHVRPGPGVPVKTVAGAVIAGSGVVIAATLAGPSLPARPGPALVAPAPPFVAVPGLPSAPDTLGVGGGSPAPAASPSALGWSPVATTSSPVFPVPASSVAAAQPVGPVPEQPSASPATSNNGYGHQAAQMLTAPPTAPSPTACVAPSASPTPDPDQSHGHGRKRKP